MAIYTVSADDVSLKSSWKVVYVGGSGQYYMSPTPSTSSAERTFSFSGIPSGSTINSAALYSTLDSPPTGAAVRTLNGTNFYGSQGISATPGGSFVATFRFKANGIANNPSGDRSSTLHITGISVVVDYTPPSSDPGVMSLNKSSLVAGETITIALTAADSGISREVTTWHGSGYNTQIGGVALSAGSGATSITFTVPQSWCTSLMPNKTSASLLFYMKAYVAGGTVINTQSKYITVNLPSTAVPEIGTFTSERVAGVPAGITDYVQGISGVTLTIGNAIGALGSTIKSYSVTGGGFSQT